MLFSAALLCASVALIQAKTRIVGGTEATYGDFPYICSLQINVVDNSWMHICGSVIWNNYHLVTAAHCVGGKASSYRVMCGKHNFSKQDQYEVRHEISNYVMHPDYEVIDLSFRNDIAVLTLSSPLTFNSHVNKITFAPADSGSFEGESCVLSGWGLLSGYGFTSPTLREISLTAIKNTECKHYFPDHRPIFDVQMCYYRGEGYDVCFRDSGGPSVCGGLMTGITSWGPPDCNGTDPAVYTRVSYFYDWLVKNAGSN